ncbi:MAG: pirin family protein [Saprospiraceae bacterium]|nr:pirin family protein [Saprospiraceae bacterium]
MSNPIIRIKPLGFPWETMDPFLFCAYHRDEYPAGNEEMGPEADQLKGHRIGQDFDPGLDWRMYHGSTVPGFPFHPHRGFETITINVEGVVDHSDSLGAAGRFMAGDVQWMTAGKGVLHSEMFPLLHPDQPNPLEIFQIWLNLPAKSKMVEPHFKMLWREDIPVLRHVDDAGRSTIVDLIAGSLNDMQALDPTPDSWAAREEHAVGVFTVKMSPDAEWTLPKTSVQANRTLFFYKGDYIEIGGQKIAANQLIHARSGYDITIKNGGEAAFLLVLQGVPIDEPVAQHGPFVMNTKEEIRQAMIDYQETQFGGWPWKEREKVHPREKGRFALHANGEKEERD